MKLAYEFFYNFSLVISHKIWKNYSQENSKKLLYTSVCVCLYIYIYIWELNFIQFHFSLPFLKEFAGNSDWTQISLLSSSSSLSFYNCPSPFDWGDNELTQIFFFFFFLFLLKKEPEWCILENGKMKTIN